MKKIFLAIILISLLPVASKAQFTMQGKITYQRKINLQRQLDDMGDNSWLQNIRSQLPQFVTSNFDMYFNTAETIYKPGKETDDKKVPFGKGPASDNVVYTNFKTDSITASKKVFETDFLIKDSIRRIKWKIKDEIRTIDNYKCRKAVGVICDSVYVVAFYAVGIPVSSGPEMFGSLPGMILELAIPRLYTTWIAQNIEVTPPKPEDFTIPHEGKKVTQKELANKLENSNLKDWGKMAQRYFWWSLI